MTGVKHPGEYQTVEDLKRSSKQEQALQAEKEKVKQEIEVEKSNVLQVIHREAVKLDVRERAVFERERAAADKESQNKEEEEKVDEYKLKVKGIQFSLDKSMSNLVHTLMVPYKGRYMSVFDFVQLHVNELVTQANEQKQKAKPKHAFPKTVNYAQKAMGEAGRQVGSMIEKSARESIERKKLSIPPSWHEDESDEYSY